MVGQVGSVFTEDEKVRAAGFILTEANGQRSRANVVVASGQGVCEAGQVMAGPETAMVKYTDGAVATGILIYKVDATSEAVAVSAIVREAEVNVKCLTYPEETTSGADKADMIASLALKQIIARD